LQRDRSADPGLEGDLRTGAVVAIGTGGASLLTETGWLALAGGTAGLGTTMVLILLLVVVGYIDPRSRKFRAALLICALMPKSFRSCARATA
jgi:hypothetical protein